MMRGAMEAESDVITVHLSQREDRNVLTGRLIDAASLDGYAWASLIEECRSSDQENFTSLSFLLSRQILMQKSSFFRSLLGGDFRESSAVQVHVTWEIATFCCLLQCICLEEMHISSLLMEHVLEAILFFGVESAIPVVGEAIKRKDLLKWAPKIWNLANGMGQQSVADICVESIAINFEAVANGIDLQDLSPVLIAACLDHNQLTVTSEKALGEIILNWLFYQHNSSGYLSEKTIISNLCWTMYEGQHKDLQEKNVSSLHSITRRMFQKIRVLLLPLDFSLGHLYQGLAVNLLLPQVSIANGYDKLALLMEEAANKEITCLETAENEEFSLRMTEHSVRIDIAGCQQITTAVLFHAVLRIVKQRCVNDSQSFLKIQSGIQKAFSDEVFLSSLKYFDKDWSQDLLLRNLTELNLERCWRLDQERLAMWLCLVCPNLKFLNVSHCPQLRINILPQISLGCKNLETLDLSLYFANPPIKPFGGYEVQYLYPRYRWCNGLLKFLTTLSLHGRNSLVDGDLKRIARCCPNVSSVNLGGCCQLTDKGLSIFLSNYDDLIALGAAYTAFGVLSCVSLIQKQMHHLNSCCMLTDLNLEGCWGLEEDSIAKLVEQASLLRNLNLGFTSVGDKTVHSFRGSGLQALNLQETKVSHGLGHILHQNPNLKVLNSRGCKQANFCLTIGEIDGQFTDARGLCLRDLAVGWGFSDLTLKAWKPLVYSLQSLTIGVGGILSESAISTLHEICPSLEKISLKFQAISDENILNLLKYMPKLRVLGLHYCLGDIPSSIFHVISSNLTRLSFERGVAWMTDASISLLAEKCKGLTQLSLIGCRLLTSRSFQTIVQVWPGIVSLRLEECGSLHSVGGSCLFSCRALREVTLRHNGLGLEKDYVKRAVYELPLLESLSLDMCDSCDQDFDTPAVDHRRSLHILKITRCKRAKNSCWQGLKYTVVIDWNDMRQRTLRI